MLALRSTCSFLLISQQMDGLRVTEQSLVTPSIFPSENCCGLRVHIIGTRPVRRTFLVLFRPSRVLACFKPGWMQFRLPKGTAHAAAEQDRLQAPWTATPGVAVITEDYDSTPLLLQGWADIEHWMNEN